MVSPASNVEIVFSFCSLGLDIFTSFVDILKEHKLSNLNALLFIILSMAKAEAPLSLFSKNTVLIYFYINSNCYYNPFGSSCFPEEGQPQQQIIFSVAGQLTLLLLLLAFSGSKGIFLAYKGDPFHVTCFL